jgi:hypothetical protein
VRESPPDTWRNIDAALYRGSRGLPGKSSLAKLLAERRGVRNHQNLPRLSERQILAWADAHHRRTGRWPYLTSGRVLDAPAERWSAIHTNLQLGQRGLRGGSSLARLLERQRGVRNIKHAPALSIARILRWADAHRRRTGAWPQVKSGRVADAPDEAWSNLDQHLRIGSRGLRGGSSLAGLLSAHRGVRNAKYPPKLTVRQILAWADAHYLRNGRWPNIMTGPLREAPGETWLNLNQALRKGLRNLPRPPRARSLPELLRRRHPPRRAASTDTARRSRRRRPVWC